MDTIINILKSEERGSYILEVLKGMGWQSVQTYPPGRLKLLLTRAREKHKASPVRPVFRITQVQGRQKTVLDFSRVQNSHGMRVNDDLSWTFIK